MAPFRYNVDNVGTEGGLPNVQPAFASGQDNFLASLGTKGEPSPASTGWHVRIHTLLFFAMKVDTC